MYFDEDLLTPPPLSPRGYLTYRGIMESPPEHWGQCGDLYLWDQLRDFLGNDSVPEESEELRNRIAWAFENYTGKSIDSCGDVALSKYVTKNSDCAIVVSPEFWRETAIPLLIERSQQHFSMGKIDISGIYGSIRDHIRVTRTALGITIKVLTIDWDEPHTPVGKWITLKELPLDCKIEVEYAKVLRSKHFGFCDYCFTYNNTGHMFEKRMCQSCASRHLGVVY
ncbi:hypothetical protein [Vibrio alfacsensis]|uniref:hypothetical protein n=1 Tax=Vibrio TaxID=662 RepID=UPI0040687FA1